MQLLRIKFTSLTMIVGAVAMRMLIMQTVKTTGVGTDSPCQAKVSNMVRKIFILSL